MKLSSKDNHNGTFTITNSTYGFILVMDSHNNVLSVESTTESGVAINNVLNTLTKLKYKLRKYNGFKKFFLTLSSQIFLW